MILRTTTLLPIVLLAVACHKPAGQAAAVDAGADAKVAAPALSASAAPSASAAAMAAGPQYHAFADKTAHRLAVERSGKTVRAILDTGTRLELVGKMTDDTHFALRGTKVAPGEKATKMTGELGSGSLTATLVDATGKSQATTWTEGPALPPKFDTELLGRIGKAFVRMKLSASSGTVTGTYRYAASTSDLQLTGTIHDDGHFELSETSNGKTTGSFVGAFASPGAVLGQWRSPDGARTAHFLAEQGDGYPASATFDDGIELFPQEKVVEGKRCRVDILFPQLRGSKNAVTLKPLNDFLRGEGAKVRTCEGPGADEPDMIDFETNESYGLDTSAGRFIGIHRDVWDYSGGAHGNFGSECFVVDTKTLKHFKLAARLTDEGRSKLGDLVTSALAKENNVAKLTEAGFNADAIELTKDSNVCLHTDGLEVIFSPYEIASYAFGPSTAKVTFAQAKPLFPKDEITTAMFGK